LCSLHGQTFRLKEKNVESSTASFVPSDPSGASDTTSGVFKALRLTPSRRFSKHAEGLEADERASWL